MHAVNGKENWLESNSSIYCLALSLSHAASSKKETILGRHVEPGPTTRT